MPLLIKDGNIIEDRWIAVDPECASPITGQIRSLDVTAIHLLLESEIITDLGINHRQFVATDAFNGFHHRYGVGRIGKQRRQFTGIHQAGGI